MPGDCSLRNSTKPDGNVVIPSEDQLREALRASSRALPMTAAELSEEARRRADVRRVRVRVGSTLAAAAVIGLAWWSTASEDALVPRGVEPAASLSLDWLVEGDGLRRVGAEPVAPDESIIFRVRATRAG